MLSRWTNDEQELQLLVFYINFCLQLLVQFRQVQLSEMFELIHTHLESSGGIKGLEERGIYFGRVFALLSLLRSGRLETTVSL